MSKNCFILYTFLRDLFDRDRCATSCMRHYVFKYTMQDALTFNVRGLYKHWPVLLSKLINLSEILFFGSKRKYL